MACAVMMRYGMHCSAMVCYLTLWPVIIWYAMLGYVLFGGVVSCSVLWGAWDLSPAACRLNGRVGAGGGTLRDCRG
eukprot:2676133-Pyramimonas_sp.AAC.1